jgi:hypothetical protein
MSFKLELGHHWKHDVQNYVQWLAERAVDLPLLNKWKALIWMVVACMTLNQISRPKQVHLNLLRPTYCILLSYIYIGLHNSLTYIGSQCAENLISGNWHTRFCWQMLLLHHRQSFIRSCQPTGHCRSAPRQQCSKLLALAPLSHCILCRYTDRDVSTEHRDRISFFWQSERCPTLSLQHQCTNGQSIIRRYFLFTLSL